MLDVEGDDPEVWLAWLRHCDPEHRQVAALRIVVASFRPFATPALLPAVLDTLRQEPDPKVRDWLLQAIKRLDPHCEASTSVLLGCLSDSESDVRLSAVQCLRNLKSPPEPILRECRSLWRSDPDERVRLTAALILAKWSPDVAMVPELVQSLVSSSDPYVRVFAAGSLGELGHQVRPHRSDLRAALKDPDGDVRAASLEALERIGERNEARAEAEACLADEDELVRRTARAILARSDLG